MKCYGGLESETLNKYTNEARRAARNAWDRTRPACFKLAQIQDLISYISLNLADGRKAVR